MSKALMHNDNELIFHTYRSEIDTIKTDSIQEAVPKTIHWCILTLTKPH